MLHAGGASCFRAASSDWCTHAGSTFFNATDCGDDGPGSTDLACVDWFGGRWVMLSSQGCVSRGGFGDLRYGVQTPANVSWCPAVFTAPRGAASCFRAASSDWCTHAGSTFFNATDCGDDGPGSTDLACVDWFGGRWVMLSSQGCVSRGGFGDLRYGVQTPANVSWCPAVFNTWAGAASCFRAASSDWCTHAGSTFFNATDCGDDGPGSTDLACVDWFGGRWVMLSSQGCVSRGGFGDLRYGVQTPANVSWCPAVFTTPRGEETQ
ncbi:hypothetical protein HYH03_000790 [Edaphochlamys debaryana]|uniref:Uncharacterized protein n=1 Tax=Edaphochlamys debaryana TaxID=47281 RepID=A0A836C6B7_9CHLO|nr:hypothetical protein HYH03_000790 [Edaphochlamys debaryana]|eukprot:KAG2500968.1 hypothetical protein HYH03_000790 [Edaphochlamys debaryana]